MGIRGELYSTKVTLENRTYFFNVKENRLGDLYLNLVESKNKDTGGFERQSIVLFADDLQEFLKGFDESLKVMEKAVRDKKKTTRAESSDRADFSEKKRRDGRDEGREGWKAEDRGGRGDRRHEGRRSDDRRPEDRRFEKRSEHDSRHEGKREGRDSFPPRDFGPKDFGPKGFGARAGFAKKSPEGHGPQRSGFKSFASQDGDFPRKKFVKGGSSSAGAHGMKKAARKTRVVRAVRRKDNPED